MRILGLNITRATQPLDPSNQSSEKARKYPESALPALSIASSPTEIIPSGERKASSASNPDPKAVGGVGAAPRLSTESLEFMANGTAFWNIFSQRKSTLRMGLQDKFDLDNLPMDFDVLSELLADLSPEISKALWDYLLLCNPGYTMKAFKPGTEDVDEAAQASLNGMEQTLGEHHGTTGVFYDRLFKMIFLRGSILMELVLADNGRDFAGIATPDTKTLSFRRQTDPVMKQVWDFGQWQEGTFVSLKRPNIAYVPLHPSGDSIEGHPICSSAFFPAIFIMAVLRDVKRVVQHQGYARLDVEVQFAQLKDTMPEEIQNNPEEINKWMQQVLEQVEKVYQTLQPDDTYIHSDSVKVNKPVGTVSADSLSGIESVISGLERMLTRALRTIPLLFASNQSRSETQSNREWEVYALGIETIQHLVESPAEKIFGLALQAQGFVCDVQVRFAVFRTAERLRDAQVDLLRSKVARENYDNGYISQDEAAQYSVEKDAADKTEPRKVAVANPFGGADGGNGSFGADQNPNPGENRSLLERLFRRTPTQPEVDRARTTLEKFAPELLIGLYGAEPIPEPEPEVVSGAPDTTT